MKIFNWNKKTFYVKKLGAARPNKESNLYTKET